MTTPGEYFETIPEMFLDRVARDLDRVALHCPSDLENGCEVTWSELVRDVEAVFDQFREYDLVGQRVVLISANRYEWIVVDLAIQFAGGIHVPMHPHLTGEQMAAQISHCQPALVVVENEGQSAKLNSCDWNCPVLSITPVRSIEPLRLAPKDPSATIQDSLSQLNSASRKVSPDSLISILYTSGTTGEPKGVMLTQANVAANVYQKLDCLPLGKTDTRLCLLPMSHIFSRTCDLYTWLATGCTTVLSLGRDAWFSELQRFRPTYINAVPYFYEKCYRLLEGEDRLAEPNALLQLLGGRVHVCNCGGAAIADHVFDYFRDQNINLVTGYGLTETAPVLTSCRLDNVRRGTVGQPVPGVEIRLTDDKEVVVRGPNIMVGYYQDPETTDAVLRDGWFHTGDVGEWDGDSLRIIGRKKEMIVTTGGMNIAPIPIEHCLNEDPIISQSIVVGDQRDYLVALIVLDESAVTAPEDRIQKQLRQRIDDRLRGFSKYFQIGRFAILPQPFTIENKMLTAKLSLRRDVIQSVYQKEIDKLYSSYSSGKTSCESP